MKVALILTGHARRYRSTFESVRHHLLDKHDVDVYLSTWSVDNPGRRYGAPDWYEPTPLDLPPLLEAVKPVKTHIQDYHGYYSNRFPSIDTTSSTRPDDIFKVNEHAIVHGTFWVERQRDQWYMIQKGWQLIENPGQYDIVFRLRVDTRLLSIELKNNGKLIIPDTEVNGALSVTDHMAYGPPDLMEKYCNFFDHIGPMYYNDNVNIAHADEMLGVYLKNYVKIPHELDNIRYEH
jgi:hypothetical protein